VVRAIELLRALNRQPVSTIDSLHKQTGIPKPSLVRMLQTLASQGLVAHAPQYGAYQLTAEVTSLSAGYHSEPRLVEAARPVAEEVTREIKWPLALAILDVDAMVVRYSTIPNSPLALLHSTMNMRLSLVSRALGRAYFAFCGAEERDALVEILKRSTNPEDAPAHDARAIKRIVTETRGHGYALREPGVRPVSGTLAIPVFEGKRVAASLGLTFFASTLSNEQAVARYLPRLKQAADEIGERLKTLGDGVLLPGGKRRRGKAAPQ
jgi:IclR family mhp operon transcriptional activator